MPSSRSNSQERFCCAISRRCSLLASRETTPCIACKLLIEEIAQPRQFLGVAKIGRFDDLVELRGVDLIAPLVLMGEGLFGPPRASCRLRAPARRTFLRSARRASRSSVSSPSSPSASRKFGFGAVRSSSSLSPPSWLLGLAFAGVIAEFSSASVGVFVAEIQILAGWCA